MAHTELEGMALSLEFAMEEKLYRRQTFIDLYGEMDRLNLRGGGLACAYFGVFIPGECDRTVLAIHEGGKLAARQTRLIVNDLVSGAADSEGLVLHIADFRVQRAGNLIMKRSQIVPTDANGEALADVKTGPRIYKLDDKDKVQVIVGTEYRPLLLADQCNPTALELRDRQETARELFRILANHTEVDREPVGDLELLFSEGYAAAIHPPD